MYKETKFNSIIRQSDGACIPKDEANTDYQAYLTWVAQGNKPEPIDPPSLAELKANIDTERDKRLVAGVTWDGKQWYTDEVFQAQITSRVAGWNAGIIPADAVKPVRSKDGAVHMLTFEQHKALALALFDYVEGVYGWSWVEKAKL